jgi:hypothetical protein
MIEQWDDAVDPASRTHTLVSVERKCSAHASLTDAQAYDASHSQDNKRKNLMFSALQTIKASVKYQDISWSFSGSGSSRVLNVNSSGTLTAQQKTQLQNACDLQFGAGKVVIT